MKKRCIYWFRKAQRLHDNPALNYALENSDRVYPVFILDPGILQSMRVGPNRWRFLAQSLADLDANLKRKGSRLLVLRGPAVATLADYMRQWNIELLCFECDTEPYAKKRDAEVIELARQMNVQVETRWSNTLYNPHRLYEKNGNKCIYTYQGFGALLVKMGKPELPAAEYANNYPSLDGLVDENLYKVPDLAELGVANEKEACGPCLYPGGETEALKRLQRSMKNETWVAKFEKPNTSPNSIEPSTTVLSPYLKFGNLSARLFYYKLQAIYASRPKHSMPPVSLEGQLLWREFFYFAGMFTENFDKMVGNPICHQIDWDDDERLVQAWRLGQTGYPFIDAIMTQFALLYLYCHINKKLRTEGWIHHLARHAVACFLTRGDLYQSWLKGVEVFEEYLLDADWSLNAANWMWLSASGFFHQYFRVYSPIAFGKKTDKNGDYIRKYLPVLKNYPTQYIYEPWTAPLSIQKQAKCLIGKDYPRPIVDHAMASKTNMARMKAAYEADRISKASDDTMREPEAKRPKTSTIDSFFQIKTEPSVKSEPTIKTETPMKTEASIKNEKTIKKEASVKKEPKK